MDTKTKFGHHLVSEREKLILRSRTKTTRDRIQGNLYSYNIEQEICYKFGTCTGKIKTFNDALDDMWWSFLRELLLAVEKELIDATGLRRNMDWLQIESSP